MEASVVVCEPLKPPCFCHTENQPEVHKTATQKRARGARAVLCAVRAVRLFPSISIDYLPQFQLRVWIGCAHPNPVAVFH